MTCDFSSNIMNLIGLISRSGVTANLSFLKSEHPVPILELAQSESILKSCVVGL